MAGYPVFRTQVKYGPRDILQFGLKGLSLHYTEINNITYAEKTQ